MSSLSVSFPTRLNSAIHICCLTDRNCRRSSRYGLLELPRGSLKIWYHDHVSHPLIYCVQNVAGRTLVGLRFWNQVSCLHIPRSRLGLKKLTHDVWRIGGRQWREFLDFRK